MAKQSERLTGSNLERLLGHCLPEPNSGCWIWTASLGGRGYGQLWTSERSAKRAHVLSYELFKGEVPLGAIVRHSCDVRCCINPDHLLLGSAKDNSRDAVERDRQAKGGIHGQAKLSEDSAYEILRSQGSLSAATLSRRYDVSVRQIYNIWRGKKWKHLPRPHPHTEQEKR